jgi:hypothetical protein
MNEARWEPRQPRTGKYSLTWQGPNSTTSAVECSGLDVSTSGIGLECVTELKTGSIVQVQASDGSLRGTYEVVHCTRKGGRFHAGLERRDETQESPKPAAASVIDSEPDHYETLQINCKADAQTIHRVFRMMATRYHPDNPETGDVEQFLRMKRAYSVLSDPELRAEYDTILEKTRDDGPRPIFGLKDFVTGVEAEANRRLGVLCLLYTKRQTSPEAPGVSLLDLEQEMGFPREYLSFTIWYLRSKDFITVADNSDYALTASGADFVEEKAVRHDIVGRLLNTGGIHGKTAKRSTNGADRQGPRLLA